MADPDFLVRGTTLSGRARAFACQTTNLVNELQRRHHTWPVATAALGRTASISAMMATMLKEEERLTVQIKGDGPLGAITADADSEGNVRGFVENPHVHLPPNAHGKLDVGGAVGRGMLYVMRDMGLRDFYQGSSELQSGEIADDFTYYFAVSEQVPSTVAAGVLVDTDNTALAAGGFIVQLLPGHTEEDIVQLEQRLHAFTSVTDFLMQGRNAEDMLRVLAPETDSPTRQSLQFHCTCSRHRLAGVLKSLGQAEIQSMIDEQGEAEVVCHFCNEVYLFSKDELQGLIS